MFESAHAPPLTALVDRVQDESDHSLKHTQHVTKQHQQQHVTKQQQQQQMTSLHSPLLGKDLDDFSELSNDSVSPQIL